MRHPYLLLLSSLLYASPVLAQAPANDTRAGASEIRADLVACSLTRQRTNNATASGTIPRCAPASQTAPARDLWYYFEAPQADVTVYARIADDDNNALVVEVTDAQGDSVACGSFSYSARQFRLAGLTPGARYYVRLAHTDPDDTNELSLCVYRTPSCLPVESVNTRNGQNWTVVSWSPEVSKPGDVYRVVVGPRRNFEPTRDTPFQRAITTLNSAVIWNLEPGEAYDVYVERDCGGGDRSRYVGPTQRFSQDPAGPPENDNLTTGRGAQLVGSGFSACRQSPGSTRFATGGDGPAGPCGGAAAVDDDVWYTLSASASRYRVQVTGANGTTGNLVLEAYNSAGERIRCANEQAGAATEGFVIDGLADRERLNFRVYTAGAGEVSDFIFCAYREEPPVAQGTGCQLSRATNFDGTGATGALVDILTDGGTVVASVENTQDLGTVRASYYGHGGELRRFGNGNVRYANRNLAIVPERQPTAPLQVRLYVSGRDLEPLIAAGLFPSSALTDPSITRQLLAIAKVRATTCSAAFPGGAEAVTFLGAGPYGNGDYYVDVRVRGFSEFFFSSVDEPLPATVVGVREADGLARLQVSPVPARGEAWVTLPQNETNVGGTLTLSDVSGRVLAETPYGAEETRLAVDVSRLPAGLYVARVRDAQGRGVGVAKVVVQ